MGKFYNHKMSKTASPILLVMMSVYFVILDFTYLSVLSTLLVYTSFFNILYFYGWNIVLEKALIFVLCVFLPDSSEQLHPDSID